jgi:hypothetical protein
MRSDICGYCKDETKSPNTIYNRPGLKSLVYRINTHAGFMAAMEASLASAKIQDLYPLKNLTSRSRDDPILAMLDAWATVADVLTFYQERIANEGYLRTATERSSLLELARLVEYPLKAGTASSVYLAYTLENGYIVDIPAGSRSQSLPEPGEQPQSFETSENLKASYEWNALKPRMIRPQLITKYNVDFIKYLYLKGITTNIKPNDPLLFAMIGDEMTKGHLRWVDSVETKPADSRTDIILREQKISKEFEVILYSIFEVLNSIANNCRDLDSLMNNAGVKVILENFDMGGLNGESIYNIIDKLEQVQQSAKIDSIYSSIIENLIKTLKELDIEAGTVSSLVEVVRDRGDISRDVWEYWISNWISEFQIDPKIACLKKEMASWIDCLKKIDQPQKGPSLGRYGILDLIEPLSFVPSALPTTSKDQVQRIDMSSDLGSQIQMILKPDLKNKLYAAIANAILTRPSDLDKLYAFRVKAMPFGHNAPLKPVFGENGAIVNQIEWPISRSTILEVRLSHKLGHKPVQHHTHLPINPIFNLVQLKFSGILGTYSAEVSLSGRTSLGEIDVEIEIPTEIIYIFRFFLHNSNDEIKSMKITLENGNLACNIQFKKEDKVVLGMDLASGQSHSRSIDGRNVVATFAPGPTRRPQPGSISIMDETLLGPVQKNIISLEGEHDKIVPGSFVIIDRSEGFDFKPPLIYIVNSSKIISKAKYGITGKATELVLDREWLSDTDISLKVLRNITIYAQSEPLGLSEEPINPVAEPVSGDEIELDGLYGGLQSGRMMIISGERTDIPGTEGVNDSEVIWISDAEQRISKIKCSSFDLPGDKTHTFLKLKNPLAFHYKRDTVTIYGNVVEATHGETREEVLGSGDSTKILQSFKLHQSPLTRLAAAAQRGSNTTLKVSINDILWQEADSFSNLGYDDHSYISFTDNEDKTTIMFGDGIHGSRLPTGVENVKAVYRIGIGSIGNVKAEQISLLISKPLGVKGVINPREAYGGLNRESPDRARVNAPLAPMALDRFISAKDYEDFACNFGGIGKASAIPLFDGRRKIIHISVLGSDNVRLDKNSNLFVKLVEALNTYGNPRQQIRVDIGRVKLLIIKANIKVKRDSSWKSVEPEIRVALLDHFSLERRNMGQDVYLNEVIGVIQNVQGVENVDIDTLDSISDPRVLYDTAELSKATGELKPILHFELARIDSNGNIIPAELAYLSSDQKIRDTLMLSEV